MLEPSRASLSPLAHAVHRSASNGRAIGWAHERGSISLRMCMSRMGREYQGRKERGAHQRLGGCAGVPPRACQHYRQRQEASKIRLRSHRAVASGERDEPGERDTHTDTVRVSRKLSRALRVHGSRLLAAGVELSRLWDDGAVVTRLSRLGRLHGHHQLPGRGGVSPPAAAQCPGSKPDRRMPRTWRSPPSPAC